MVSTFRDFETGHATIFFFIMLIARKNSSCNSIFIDFRFLNNILQRLNLALSLIRDAFTILGNYKCECLSVSDLKDAYHTIQLSYSSKPYCGILPYFIPGSYVYQKCPGDLAKA